MIIQCDNCKRKFRLDDGRIQPPGARVRCSKCGEIFYVPVEVEGADNDVQLEFGGNNPFDESSPLKHENESEKIYDADSIASMIQSGLVGTEDHDEDSSVGVKPESEEGVEAQRSDAPDQTTDTIDKGTYQEEENSGEKNQATGISGHYAGEGNAGRGSEEAENPFMTPELTVDRDAIYKTYPESRNDTDQNTVRESPGRVYRSRRSKGGFIKNLFIFIFTILIVATLFVSGLYLLGQFNVVSKEYFNKYKKLALSYLPVKVGEKNPGRFLKITDDKGQWIDSRYGQVYLVSGKVLNTSGKTVNYIKLKSDFYSVEDLVYEQQFYAGNTLTLNEIKNLPFSSISERLKRKSGDVNYSNVDKLAGMNFDIKPGATIPFYTVFPSKSRILGLDYRISVIDFNISGGNIR